MTCSKGHTSMCHLNPQRCEYICSTHSRPQSHPDGIIFSWYRDVELTSGSKLNIQALILNSQAPHRKITMPSCMLALILHVGSLHSTHPMPIPHPLPPVVPSFLRPVV